MSRIQHPLSLQILARGSRCPACGAYPDEPCTTRKGAETEPHTARVDRAVKQFQARRTSPLG